MKAVKIYSVPEDWKSAIDRWVYLGLDTIMLGTACLGNENFLTCIRAKGLKWSIIEPVLLSDESDDPSFMSVDCQGQRAVDDWVRFACPTDKRRLSKILKQLETHAKMKPDGMSLDFIRFFQFWEKIKPNESFANLVQTCYCPSCTESFSAWSQATGSNEIGLWRCKVIEGIVSKAVAVIRKTSPETQIGLHSVPWLKDDYQRARQLILGQDLAALAAYVDYLTPMTYHHMMGRPPSFIGDLVTDQSREINGGIPVIPCIQVKPYYNDMPLATAEFLSSLEAALKPPSLGIAFFQWEDLASEPEKFEAARIVLANKHE